MVCWWMLDYGWFDFEWLVMVYCVWWFYLWTRMIIFIILFSSIIAIVNVHRCHWYCCCHYARFFCVSTIHIYIYIHFFIMIIVLVIYCYNHSCECISKYHHYYGSYFHCCHHHSCHSQDDCYDYHCHHSHFVGIVIVYCFCYYCVVVHICLDSIWGRSSPSNSPHQDYYMFSP